MCLKLNYEKIKKLQKSDHVIINSFKLYAYVDAHVWQIHIIYTYLFALTKNKYAHQPMCVCGFYIKKNDWKYT